MQNQESFETLVTRTSDDDTARFLTVRLADGKIGTLIVRDDDTFQSAYRVAETLRHAHDGRTEFVSRCGCYRGGLAHSPNSGRCTATSFYAKPEQRGLCPLCSSGGCK